MKSFVAFVQALFLVGLFVVGLWVGAHYRGWLGIPEGPRIHSSAAVVRQVQSLAQLVTVRYVLEKVVAAEDVKWYGQNRLLLLAHGVVKAGVDLTRVQPGDVEIAGDRLVLRLPAPRVTDAYLDESQTRVIDRETGLLRRFDKEMEQMARQAALREIRLAAHEAGILREAEEQAREQLTRFFQAAGFREVLVEFHRPGGTAHPSE
ncbi:DUF4230 domain-containing protein [Limisphaera sp. 4302-co]|uniref:DUF4230 domain-containing protein n=1 Tax=Limisphaera sp. 4302-co TaxID=3400417 RepID=UPI003C2154E4